MPEIAINEPLDAGEIKDILCQELRKRLDQLSPLSGGKQFANFTADFTVRIKLHRVGEEAPPKETLAWGKASGVAKTIIAPGDSLIEEIAEIEDGFKSQDPNEERVDRGMPLTVEAKDGRGHTHRKKVLLRG